MKDRLLDKEGVMYKESSRGLCGGGKNNKR